MAIPFIQLLSLKTLESIFISLLLLQPLPETPGNLVAYFLDMSQIWLLLTNFTVTMASQTTTTVLWETPGLSLSFHSCLSVVYSSHNSQNEHFNSYVRSYKLLLKTLYSLSLLLKKQKMSLKGQITPWCFLILSFLSLIHCTSTIVDIIWLFFKHHMIFLPQDICP